MNASLPRSVQLPATIGALAARLEQAGFGAWWVGESLHDALRGQAPRQWSLATEAPPDAIARLFPTAVPTRPNGLAFVVPSAAGPVDLAPLTGREGIAEDLLGRGFSVLAMAWRGATSSLEDPHGGSADLVQGRLRAVTTPRACLTQAPLRSLQAARLVAQHGYCLDPDLEAQMPAAWRESGNTANPLDLRREISGLFRSPRPGAGIDLLRRTRIATSLGFETGDDCARLLDELPADPALRWAICLRGSSDGHRCLQRLRVPAEFAARIRLFLRHHPVDETTKLRRRLSVRRLRARVESRDIDLLFALREAEIQDLGEANEIRENLTLLRLALAREQDEAVAPLALDAAAVMNAIGTETGPRIGQALAFLRRRIAEDPACNEPQPLLKFLAKWSAENPPPLPCEDARP